MQKVYIFSGLPGSGKTSIIRRDHAYAVVVSADHYFERDGEYRFEPSRLPDAHALCMRRFVNALILGTSEIVVDNTNCTTVEIAPYAAVALAYGYEVQIVTVECEPHVAHARNIHGVPLATVLAMSERLDRRELMPWWDSSVIFTDGSDSEGAA